MSVCGLIVFPVVLREMNTPIMTARFILITTNGTGTIFVNGQNEYEGRIEGDESDL